jgi:uroporphyrinogen-III synthase
VLLSARETLRGLGPALSSRGLSLRRIEAIRVEPAPASPSALRAARASRVDTVLVTSRHAVGPTLRAWARARDRAGRPELWAAGPGTAQRLRRLGLGPVRRGAGLGGSGVVRALGPRPRTIVHVRSDVAGGVLAQELRARGHRVREVVAYRVRANPAEVRRREALLRRACALVLTSPSTVASLRRAVGKEVVRELGRTVPAVVLGKRTARAAAAAGFRTVSVAPETSPQRFARLVVRTVDHAAA